jgi:hypothetical protein
MSETITFGGAQIPVTTEIDDNVIIIKQAIDWASENSVDFLATPEGSVSGYSPWFNQTITSEKIQSAIDSVVDYAVEKSVGLFLGTKYKISDGMRTFNQIRVYDKSGVLQGIHNKRAVVEWDNVERPDNENMMIKNIELKFKDKKILVLPLICNDLWGPLGGDGVVINAHLFNPDFNKSKAHIIIHNTNAFRDDLFVVDDVLYEWNSAVIRYYSYDSKSIIMSTDNSSSMEGHEYTGRTASRSGIAMNGTWLTEEKNKGIYYFKHTFDLEKLVNYEYDFDPDQELRKKYNMPLYTGYTPPNRYPNQV